MNKLKQKQADDNDRARRAVGEFRKLQPTLTAYARNLTGRREVQVVMSASTNGNTDGKKIYFRPPLALGDLVGARHNRIECDRRDPVTYKIECKACAIREAVLATIYHEISHIAFDSFQTVTEVDTGTALTMIRDSAPAWYYERIGENFLRNSRIVTGKSSFHELAHVVNPAFKGLVNALEDVRINERMFQARPGTRIMREATVLEVAREGVEQPNGERVHWRDYKPNQQAIVASLLYAEGYALDEVQSWFGPEVALAIQDTELLGLLGQVHKLETVQDVFTHSFRVFLRWRDLGFFILENEEMPEPPEDSDDSEPDDSASDSSDDAGAGESGMDGEPDDGESSSDAGGSDGGESDPAESESDRSGSDGGSDDEGAEQATDGDVDSAESSGGEESGQPGDDSASGEDADTTGADGTGGSDPSDRAGDSEGSAADGDSEPDNGDGEGSGDTGSTGPEELGSNPGTEHGDPGDGTEESDVPAGSSNASGDVSGDADGDLDQSDEADGSGDAGYPSGDEGAGSSGDEPSLGDDWDAGNDTGGTSDGGTSKSGGDDDVAGGGQRDRDGGPDAEEDDAPSSGSSSDDASTDDLGSVDPLDYKPEAESAVDWTDEDLARGGQPPRMGEDEPVDLIDLGLHPELFERAEGDEPDGKTPEDEAMESAIIQSIYFEMPSARITGLKVWKYADRGADSLDRPQHAWGGYRYEGALREQMMPDPEPVEESVMGPALMKMRLVFADNDRARHNRNQRSGKIDTRTLGKRAWSGDDRLFGRKVLPKKKDYFVCIMADISGSTRGMNLKIIKEAVLAQADLCHRMGIKFAVYAHTGSPLNTAGWDSYPDGMWVDLYEVKSVDQPWDNTTREAITSIAPSAANLDGHTLEFARKLCDAQTETNKVILYYSDGAMPLENHDEELEILQREIALCKMKRYTLLGVGIRTDSPSRHGMDTVQVDSSAEVGKVVAHLERALIV